MSASQAAALQAQSAALSSGQGGDITDKLNQLKLQEQNKQQQQPAGQGAGAAASPTAAASSGAPPAKKKEMGAVRYAAERVIGNGSFGVVYQATVIETGETVAIKKVLQVRSHTGTHSETERASERETSDSTAYVRMARE